jgi:GT2 family glycosyltransferase
MKIFVSVVSHGHSNLINELSSLALLSEKLTVVVKSNQANDDFESLSKSNNFHWIDKYYNCGFGKNNNIVFKYCKDKLAMEDKDYFLVLNPDVIANASDIINLIEDMRMTGTKLATINLFRDRQYINHDNSIRSYPSFMDFASSILGLGNRTVINKENIEEKRHVDWSAGSFLAFKSGHYAELSGFDERFFMYCEDMDICYRSKQTGTMLVYYPCYKATHLAKHANRKVLSKHFYWHISSALRFLIYKKIGSVNRKKILKSCLDKNT